MVPNTCRTERKLGCVGLESNIMKVVRPSYMACRIGLISTRFSKVDATARCLQGSFSFSR